MRVVSITWGGLYAIVLATSYYCSVHLYIEWNILFWTIGIQMALMSVLYAVIIVILNNNMKKLAGDYKDEISSINWQFSVYLFSYIVRGITAFAHTTRLDPYENCLILLIGLHLENVVPAIFVLYQHHKVFSIIARMSKVQ